MGNEIVNGVSNAINAVFGDCDIYQNDVTQGFSEPCFFIALLQETRRAYPNGRASRQYLLDISYFPEDGGDNRTMVAVSEELLDALSMIKLQDGSFLRGTNLSAGVTDDVLHCGVTYTRFTQEITEQPLMQSSEISTII